MINVTAILPELTAEKLEPFTVDADKAFLNKLLAGVPKIISDLEFDSELTDDAYRQLERLDVVTDGRVASLLNKNGGCSCTVCPGCRSDDFTHVEGCKVGYAYH